MPPVDGGGTLKVYSDEASWKDWGKKTPVPVSLCRREWLSAPGSTPPPPTACLWPEAQSDLEGSKEKFKTASKRPARHEFTSPIGKKKRTNFLKPDDGWDLPQDGGNRGFASKIASNE